MRRSPSLRITHEHWSTGDAVAAGIGFLLGVLGLMGIVWMIATAFAPKLI